jgi:hypothetical protein
MRLNVAPEFSSKLPALTPADLQHISTFVNAVTDATNREDLLIKVGTQIQLLDEDIYISQAGQSKVFFTFGTDEAGEYILLLDTSTERSKDSPGYFFAAKDPRRNNSLNPKFNTAINPRFNTALNPRFNTAINPRFNTTLNPRFNTAINPRFNTTFNPRFNTSINPRFNTSLNPRFNTSLNPRMNRAFGGPYLYDVNMRQEGYIVRANEKVNLIFDLSANHVGEYVTVNENYRARFDMDNNWVGYLIPANEDVGLLFDLDADWIGLAV